MHFFLLHKNEVEEEGPETQLYSNLQGFINSAYNYVPNPKVAIKSNNSIMQRDKLLKGFALYTLALFLLLYVKGDSMNLTVTSEVLEPLTLSF